MTALYAFDAAPHATVLAALRVYQIELQRLGAVPSNLIDIATNGGTVTPLNAAGIDALCESLNHKGLTFGDVVNLLGEDESNPYVAGASEHRLANDLSFDGKVMVSNGDDSGAYVMCWLWVSDELAGVEPDDDDDEPARAGDAITDEMLEAAAYIDDLDEALRSVMDQVGITDGGCAGLVFSGDKDHNWWQLANASERFDMLCQWRDSEQASGELAPTLGDRAACKLCDQDIEWSGDRGWRDRGGNRQCVTTIRRGEIVQPAEGQTHVPVRP